MVLMRTNIGENERNVSVRKCQTAKNRLDSRLVTRSRRRFREESIRHHIESSRRYLGMISKRMATLESQAGKRGSEKKAHSLFDFVDFQARIQSFPYSISRYI